jgi:membrane protease YdiL (CAAX protease family)
MSANWPWYWWIVGYYWFNHILFALLLVLLVVGWRLPVKECFGRLPRRRELVGGVLLTAFVWLVSVAAFYAVFYPLSLVAPDFVQRWYIDLPGFIVFDFPSGTYPPLPNVFSFLTLCVVGPVLEEITFRGIILPRWSRKWGLSAGILASSTLFALPHTDPVGAFVFGLAMSVLYLKTQSLTLPIVCHGLNNFIAWLQEALYLANYGPDRLYTLEDFQAEWPIGAGAGAIAILWLVLYVRRPGNDVRWRLPVA